MPTSEVPGEAQLTRLQRILGLKKRIHGEELEKLNQGVIFPEVSRNERIDIQPEDDAIVIYMDLRIITSDINGALPTSIEIGAAVLDTTQTAAPPSSFKKLIYDTNVNRASATFVPKSSQEDVSGQARLALAQLLEPPYSLPLSGGKPCPPQDYKLSHSSKRKSIVLLLSDVDAVCHALVKLGFDLREHLHVIEILDVRDLHQAYEIRKVYRYMTPSVASRMTITLDLSTLETILESRGKPQGSTGTSSMQGLRTLQAVVSMSICDSHLRSWMRNAAQVDGGDFPGPWRSVGSASDLDTFLLEYEASVSMSCCVSKLKDILTGMKEMSSLISSNLTQERARLYNYTELYEKIVRSRPSTSTTDEITSISNSTAASTATLASSAKPKATDAPCAAPVNSKASPSAAVPASTAPPVESETLPVFATSPPPAQPAKDQTATVEPPQPSESADPLKPLYSPELNERLPSDLGRTVYQYQEAGQAFLKLLLQQVDPDIEFVEGKSQRLEVSSDEYGTKTFYMEWEEGKEYEDEDSNGYTYKRPSKPRITGQQYKWVASALASREDWYFLHDMADLLKASILGREKLTPWYAALPPEDKCFKDNPHHVNHIKVLKEVWSILDRPYWSLFQDK